MLVSKKKIFILFSGELRFFHENLLSINDYFIDYEIIFLFYPWEYESKKIEIFQKYYKNDKFCNIYQNNWDKYLEKIKYPDNASNIPSLFYMWDALTQSFSKIKNDFNENDLILRFRTDIKINSKKLFLNLNNIKDNTLYIPDRYHWNGLNDQVFLTKVKTLDNFSNFFEFVNNSICRKEFISPEYIFYKFIKKKKIKIVFFDLDYQLLRDKKKEPIIKKNSYIPVKDKIIIKFLKISYKFRNFKKFYLDKKKEIKRKTYFMTRNFLILMSGGTTPVINSTLVAIVKKIKKKSGKIKIFSGLPGIDGVLNNNFIDLKKFSQSKLEILSKIPGSHFVGTTRLKRLDNKEMGIFKNNLQKKKIKNIINIGGNGTLQQTIDFSKRLKEFNFISCPKTVDNDLGDVNFKKMLYNPGFASCVKVWKFFLEMINLENIGAKSHDKIIISQTFGRQTGFICGSIRYWDKKRKLPIMLLLPEDKQNFIKILTFIKKRIKQHGRLMIFLAEGYNLSNIIPLYDKSGQIMYGSSGTSSAQILSNKLNKKGIQSRIFNPTILQRVFSYNNQVLNKKDYLFAKNVGEFAVKLLLENKKSFLIGLSEKNKVIPVPFNVCKKYSRKMTKNFIKKKQFDVSNEYLKYIKKVMS